MEGHAITASPYGTFNAKYYVQCESTADRLASVSQWEPDRLRWVKIQIARHRHDIRKLSELWAEGKNAHACKSQTRILKSFAGRTCGELYQIHRSMKKAGKLPPLSWEAFEDNVRRSPIMTGKGDLAILYAKKKSKGGKRFICKPGPRVRAAQAHFTQVLDSRGLGSICDYNAPGLGHKAAVDQVCKLMLDSGFTHFVVYDIKDCFSSVKPKHLEWLQMSPKVIKSCVCFADTVSVAIFNATLKETKMARQGLPQGAPASAKIVSALLGRELSQIGGDLGKVTYVDDGVIGACSQAEAAKVAKALKMRLANLAGGPIGLKKLEICHAESGFAFLGYWIRVKMIDGERVVKCSPSHAAKERAKRRLFGRLRKSGNTLSFDEAIKQMDDYIENWRMSFPLWKPTQLEIDTLHDEAFFWVEDYFSGWTKKKPPVLSDVSK